MKAATCIADLEDHIAEIANTEILQAGQVVAHWSSDPTQTIAIAGRWRGRGYSTRWCIRWVCPAVKGTIFHKGLAGYSGPPIPEARLAHLPVVK